MNRMGVDNESGVMLVVDHATCPTSLLALLLHSTVPDAGAFA